MESYSGEGHTLFLDGTDKTRPLVADAPGFDNINPVLGYKVNEALVFIYLVLYA